MSWTVFFEFLQIAVGQRKSFSQSPSMEDWKWMFAEAKRQTLFGVCFQAIEILPAEQRPSRDLLLSWYALTEQLRCLNQKLNMRTVQICSYLSGQQTHSIVLKGQGIALYYPKPLLRVCGDIDIWVDAKRQQFCNLVKERFSCGKMVYHNVSCHFFSDAEVEVHFTPSWLCNYFRNRRMQRYFKREFERSKENYVDLPEEAGRICVPTLAMNRVFILQHIYRHLFGDGIGLRQMMDYYYVLQQGFTEEERLETVRQLRRLGMMKFTAAAMYVLKNVFAMEDKYLLVSPNEEEGHFLLEEIMRAGNFGKSDPRIVHPEKENKLQSFLRITRQNFRFIGHYREEVLWNPLYRAWHYLWRKWNGYL